MSDPLLRKTETTKEIVIRRIKRTEFARIFQLVFFGWFRREIEIVGFDVCRLKRMVRLYSAVSVLFFFFDILRINFETILVAVSENKLVGEIHLVPCGRKMWSIDSVFVDPQFRRRGIYRRLMQEALKYVARRHGKKIFQSVRNDNIVPLKIADELKFQAFAEKIVMYLEIGEAPFEETKADILIRKLQPTDTRRVYEMCKVLDPKRVEIYEIKPEDYLVSPLSRLRNKIAHIHSEKSIMESKGKVIGFADVIYTSKREAARLESFCLLPSRNLSELVSAFLKHLVNSLRTKNIRKIIVELNEDWLEIIEAFHCLGFQDLALQYEMVKELVDGDRYEYWSDKDDQSLAAKPKH